MPAKPSIAVLPFDNLSRDPDQEYFSDGLTEDLITDLSQLSGLFVTARHAVFQYKGRTAPPRQVAKDLGVRYVLEGSVRRAANRVRINAQLIDAATGFHLWAQRYDRDFAYIFDLQDEITHTIVAALEVHLTPRERASIERRYTDNLEAYDLFLQAREGFWSRTQQGAVQARTALERAIALDPTFAAAHALLAEICRSEWWYGWRDDEGALDRALELAQKGRGARRSDCRSPTCSSAGFTCGARSTSRQSPQRSAAWRSTRTTPRVMSVWAISWTRLGGQRKACRSSRTRCASIRTIRSLHLLVGARRIHSLERYEEAIVAFQRTISRKPDFFYARHWSCSCLRPAGPDGGGQGRK